MAKMSLNEAWRIWIIPVGLYWILSSISVFILLRATSDLPRTNSIVKNGEIAITFVLLGLLLITWYIIMVRYERVKCVQVRKRIKVFWRFFLVVYLLGLLRLSYELVILIFR